jgi:protein-tyrosine phosphatase
MTEWGKNIQWLKKTNIELYKILSEAYPTDDYDNIPFKKKLPRILKLDPIPFSNGAKLYMTAAPLDTKEAEIISKKAIDANITTVVVLLEQQDLDRIYIDKGLFDVYEENGLRVIHYPIVDYGVPKDFVSFNKLVEMILTLLKNKSNVLVHCHGGHGRTGIIVVGCFVRLGKTVEQAYEYVSKIRSIIDNNKQFDFLDRYERWVKVNKLRGENDDKRGATSGSK